MPKDWNDRTFIKALTEGRLTYRSNPMFHGRIAKTLIEFFGRWWLIEIPVMIAAWGFFALLMLSFQPDLYQRIVEVAAKAIGRDVLPHEPLRHFMSWWWVWMGLIVKSFAHREREAMISEGILKV